MIISYSFIGFDAFVNVPLLIIIRFGENVLWKIIDFLEMDWSLAVSFLKSQHHNGLQHNAKLK